DPGNAAVVASLVDTYVCPSDGSAENAILTNRAFQFNPATCLGLWYPVSIGPTVMDWCPFCPDQNPSPTNYCCQGYNFGTGAGAGYPEGNSVGMFGRYYLP